MSHILLFILSFICWCY